MHWLETQVTELHRLARAYAESLARPLAQARSRGTLRPSSKAAYVDFVSSARRLVDAVAAREGVTACFACHDGLLLDAAGGGAGADFEALAAMTQAFAASGLAAADTLNLGPVQQLVIVGREQKLALFVIGQLTLGVLSPTGTSLAETLAR